jgi:ribosome-associated toxin RatA of RatAB toxin-antitoxin module
MRRRGVLQALLLVPAFTLSTARAVQVALAPYTFALDREGEGFAIAAQGDLAAARATVWQTLTDYEALQRFVPGMRESRVIERRGANSVVVRQVGSARFGPFSEAFDVTFAVDEHEADRIDAVAIAGDFIEFRSHYELRQLDAQRTRLSYRARLRPRRDPPPLIGAVVMESVARGQFEALLLEIERRAR